MNQTLTNIFNFLKSSIIVILITFLMGEGVLRLWYNNFASEEAQARMSLYTAIADEEFKYAQHHYLNYIPRPNYQKDLTSNNSLGFRGSEEIEMPKPDGRFRVVAIGGSTTYTIKVLNDIEAYPAQLERVLRENYGYQDVEVINAGAGGYNSWESLINLQFRVLDLEPDLIIIYHGTNDVHPRIVEPDSYRGDNSGRRMQWQDPPIPWFEYSLFARFVSRTLGYTNQVSLESMITPETSLGNSGVSGYVAEHKDLLAQNPPIYFRRNLENMIAVARMHDVDVMLSTWAYTDVFGDYAAYDYYQQAFDEGNEVVVSVGAEHDVPVYDFANQMTKVQDFWHDGRHVNKHGALLKAELFAAFLDQNQLIPPEYKN